MYSHSRLRLSNPICAEIMVPSLMLIVNESILARALPTELANTRMMPMTIK